MCASVNGWGTGVTQPCMLAQLRGLFTPGDDSPVACRPPLGSALVAESVAAAGDKQTERMESMFANFLAMQQGTAQPQATTDTQAPPEDDAAEVAAVMLAHRQRQAAEASQPFEQLRPAAPGLIHQFSGLQPPSPADQQRSAGMQPQVLHPDRDARLWGGLQRLPTREQYIQRLQTQTEQFSAQEKDDLVHLLTIGAQVSPPHEHVHPMSELGVGRVMVQSRAAPALFRRLSLPKKHRQHKVNISKLYVNT